MTRRIALIEHNRPRILAVDFSQRDVDKIVQAGFNARRGATGLYDKDRFITPWSIHDIEIVFARVASGSFSKISERTPHEDSVEEGPFFNALFNEVWSKLGWIVLFIERGCSPAELVPVGIDNIGVLYHNRYRFPASYAEEWLKSWRRNATDFAEPPQVSFPPFKSEAVLLNEEELEHGVLKRYLHAAKFSVLSADKEIEIFGKILPRLG